jgi:hypothetical protein
MPSENSVEERTGQPWISANATNAAFGVICGEALIGSGLPEKSALKAL